MIRIISDVGKNRLILELSGTPSLADLTAAEVEMRSGIPRLRPPIDVLSDVTQLDSLENIPSDLFQKFGDALRAIGVRRVVRVVGKSKEGALQMQRLTKSFAHSAHLAFSREEAEGLLSQR